MYRTLAFLLCWQICVAVAALSAGFSNGPRPAQTVTTDLERRPMPSRPCEVRPACDCVNGGECTCLPGECHCGEAKP